MFSYSIAVDCDGGAPASVWAKEVEWNVITTEWDIIGGGHTYQAAQGGATSLDATFFWYRSDIAISGHYTMFLPGDVEIEGTEGRYCNAGERDAGIDLNTTHRGLSNNPHSTTKTHVVLANADNKSSATIRGEIVIGDLPVGDIDVKDCADTTSLLITVNDLLDGLVSGYTSANQTIEYIAAKLSGNPLFAKMLNEVSGVSSGVATPVAAVTPTRIGQLYIETTTPKLFAANGLTNVDWFAVNAGEVIDNGLTHYRETKILADDSEVIMPVGIAGWGDVMIGDSQESTNFTFTSAGVVTLIDETVNVVNTDTDTNLCVYDGGTRIKIKNRLGSSLTVAINIHYYKP